MKREELYSQQPQSDERLEQALDRLGELVARGRAEQSEFVSRVICQVRGAVKDVRRPSWPGRWLVRLAIGAAACAVVSLALWKTSAARHAAPTIAANDNREQKAAPAAPHVESSPTVRTSTWSVVTEGVVLEGDMPVRKLLYREFQRVEVLDSKGKPESSMVLPTKAMLVAGEEHY
jgi:hypothetical protein